MYPQLTIGPFHFWTRDIIVVFSFVLAIAISLKRVGKELDRLVILESIVLAVCGGTIGGHSLHFLVFGSQHPVPWWRAILLERGTAHFGGVILGFAIGLAYLRYYFRLEWSKILLVADRLVPTYFLAAPFVKLGCLAAGCCSGIPWRLPFDLVIPTQIYSGLLFLLAWLILLWLERRQTYPGYVFSWFFILLGVHRLIIDCFRYYRPAEIICSGTVATITIYQLLAMIFIAMGASLLLVLKK